MMEGETCTCHDSAGEGDAANKSSGRMKAALEQLLASHRMFELLPSGEWRIKRPALMDLVAS